MYVYDHNSSEPLGQGTEDLIASGFVQHIPITGRHVCCPHSTLLLGRWAVHVADQVVFGVGRAHTCQVSVHIWHLRVLGGERGLCTGLGWLG